MTDDPLRTRVTVEGDGEIGFQEYFVQRQHSVAVTAVRFDGAEATPRRRPACSTPSPAPTTVVIAPSNPIVSIGPVLAVPGVRDAVVARRDDVVAVSPIVAGAALKGPADRLLTELGHESSVVGVARLYAELAATLVIDEADADLAGAVEAEGLRCVVTATIMSSPERSAALARVVVHGRSAHEPARGVRHRRHRRDPPGRRPGRASSPPPPAPATARRWPTATSSSSPRRSCPRPRTSSSPSTPTTR